MIFFWDRLIKPCINLIRFLEALKIKYSEELLVQNNQEKIHFTRYKDKSKDKETNHQVSKETLSQTVPECTLQWKTYKQWEIQAISAVMESIIMKLSIPAEKLF